MLAGCVKEGDERNEEDWICIQSASSEDNGDTEFALQRHPQVPDGPDGQDGVGDLDSLYALEN